MEQRLTPEQILAKAYQQATASRHHSLVTDHSIETTINRVCRSHIGAGVRLLLACSLAKSHNPALDIRKPFTDAGEGSYSGRAYDEQYVTDFVVTHELPCNHTTAFLTPALRTKGGMVLARGTDLGGRKTGPYDDVIALLNDAHEGRITADLLLAETIRHLLLIKEERAYRVSSLLDELRALGSSTTLSAEDIVRLLESHLQQPRAARLPVLVVAAAYQTAAHRLGEQVRPLHPHTAADERTGALGDLEITLVGDDRVVTTYEMKMKRVTTDDLNRALQKIQRSGTRIDNYIFITTDVIDEHVLAYAHSLYLQPGGIEFMILDCIGFIRHFLHLFHRLRLEFLNTYQALLLAEPDSAVRQPLKEVFLALRRAAESSYANDAD